MYSKDSYPHVFSPIKIGGLTFKNRLGFAPMVCNKCTQDGTVTDDMVEFITMQANCGVAYVTIGDTQVDDEFGGAFMATLNISRRTSKPGLIRIAEAARYNGAILSVELNHSGRGANDSLISGPALAPSPISIPRGSQNVREMTHEDMERVKGLFVSCAQNCVAAGFKMVMIHGAHNNLLGQFLSTYSNQRTDEYGGNRENRRRYPLEVIRAVREAVGPEIAIELRVSATEMTEGGLEFDESLEFIKEAEKYVDLIHVSRGIVYTDAGIYTLPTYLREPMLNIEYAAKVKESISKPVATVGNFSNLDEVENAIASGKADIVCMARAFLADNEMVKKSLSVGYDKVRPCLRCHRGCIDNSARGKAIHCAVNPALGFEEEIRRIPPVQSSKNVVVVGGGPAGITAATTLAQRGHKVSLYEKNNALGGLIIDAAAPACKQYMKKYLDWLVDSVNVENIDINLNTEVDEILLDKLNPDAIFVATGSTYIKPKIEGIDNKNVLMLHDAEHNKEKVGNHVLVCGAGSAGLECALGLAMEGKKVAIADMLSYDDFGSGLAYFPRLDLLKSLEKYGVQLFEKNRIIKFTEKGVILENDSLQTEYAFDTCIVALGVRRETALLEKLQVKYAYGVYSIGDADGTSNIYEATHSAFFKAYSLL